MRCKRYGRFKSSTMSRGPQLRKISSYQLRRDHVYAPHHAGARNGRGAALSPACNRKPPGIEFHCPYPRGNA